MKKSWRTVLEGQTEKANEQIKQILQKEQAPKKKALAIFLAVVGIALIGVGVTPLLINKSGNELKASITEEAPPLEGALSADKFIKANEATNTANNTHAVANEENNFVAEATTVDNVNQINTATNNNEINILNKSKNLELLKAEGVIPDLKATAENTVEIATDTNSFRVNTHTGNTDIKTSNTYNEPITVIKNTIMPQTQEMTTTETGPAQTGLLAIFSIAIAYVFKRKKAL